MNPSDLYKAGRLGEAIEAQLREVKSSPLDASKRLFLFELLLFSGDFERAQRQAEAIEFKDPDLDAAMSVYRKLVDSERSRLDLFARGIAPGFFGEPSRHLRLRLDAINRLRESRPAEAADLLIRANEAVGPHPGRLNDRPFHSLCDADDLFAGILEVMAHGRYFWVGLEQVRALTMKAPRFPRDLLYIPTHLELEDEEGDVFVPALYPRSHEHHDDQVKLGRMTDWKELDGGLVLGVGQHTFLRDEDAVGLLEWREWQSNQATAG